MFEETTYDEEGLLASLIFNAIFDRHYDDLTSQAIQEMADDEIEYQTTQFETAFPDAPEYIASPVIAWIVDCAVAGAMDKLDLDEVGGVIYNDAFDAAASEMGIWE